MTVLYVLLALLMLGILVFVHEGGHFLGARWTGIPVREFSIGFGPKLKEWKSRKHDTVFSLRLIPAGGYCAFYGEDDPNADSQKDDPRLMTRFAVWKRLITVLLGPGMNFLLALAVAFGYYMYTGEVTGVVNERVEIGSVTPGGPAAEAGMLPGDVVIEVNGVSAVLADENGVIRFSGAISEYREGDDPLTMTVARGGEILDLSVTPRYVESLQRTGIDISYGLTGDPVYSPVTVFRAARMSFDYCAEAGGAILGSLKSLVTTGEGADELGGPVRIIQIVTEETQTYHLQAYISLMILISVNLGLINLLPIPGLDGARVLFLLYEGVVRRPVNRKVESYIHLAGFAFLLVLFVFLTYRDIVHLF